MSAPKDRLQRLVLVGNLMAEHLRQLHDGKPTDPAQNRRLPALWESTLAQYQEEKS